MHSDHLPFFYLIGFLGGSNDFWLIWKVVRATFEGPRTGSLGQNPRWLDFSLEARFSLCLSPNGPAWLMRVRRRLKKQALGWVLALWSFGLHWDSLKRSCLSLFWVLWVMWLGGSWISNEVLEERFGDADFYLHIPPGVLVILSNEAYFCGPGWNQQLGKDCCRSRGGWWDRQRPLWKSSRHCFWTSWLFAQLPAGFIRQSVDGCLKGLPCAGEPLGRNRPPDRAWHKYGCQPNEGGDQLVIWFGWQFFGFCHNALGTAVSFVVLPQN